MTYYLTKIAVTTLLVVIVSVAAKRSALLVAVLASVPIVSVLAMLWLYVDTKDVAQVAQLSRSIVWLVVPSLVLFVALPVLLARGTGFYASLGLSIAATVLAYFGTIAAARRLGFYD
jgi:hypothetical protein